MNHVVAMQLLRIDHAYFFAACLFTSISQLVARHLAFSIADSTSNVGSQSVEKTNVSSE